MTNIDLILKQIIENMQSGHILLRFKNKEIILVGVGCGLDELSYIVERNKDNYYL